MAPPAAAPPNDGVSQIDRTTVPPPIMPSPAAPPPAASPPPVAPARPAPVPLNDLTGKAPEEPLDLGLKPLAEVEPEEDITPAISVPGRRLDLGGGAPGRPLVPPSGATVTVPRTGGRTYCRWCGMESDNPRICTWCGKDLLSTPAVVTGKGPHIVTTRHIPTAKHGPARPPLTRPVRQEPPAAPPPVEKTQPVSSPAATHTGHVPPPIGMFQAQKSKYYTDKVIDTVSGAHYDADTGQSTDVAEIQIVEVEVNDKTQALIYAGILILIIAASVGLANFFAGGYLAILAVSNFFGGMLMPVLRVVPFLEDDSDDLPLAIGLILILGPLVGAMVYGVICVVRQDIGNPAIIGVFLTYLLLRIPLDLISGIPFDKLFYGMMPFMELSLPFFTKQWMAFATLGGWMCAGMFKKPDE